MKAVENIRKTLAYFDIFDYPLTSSELYIFLWGSTPLEEELFYSNLLEAVEFGLVGSQFGFYFLPGREKNIEARLKNTLLIEKKMKIALRAIRQISRVPFARAAFVCNTLAAGWPNKDSDIDLFIVAARGRIWLVRMLVTLFMGIMNLRRQGSDITDKICLSFYVSESSMDLSKIAIDQPDIYLVYWLLQLIPVYGGANYYQKVLLENKWVNNYIKNNLHNYHPLFKWEVNNGKISSVLRDTGEIILSGWLGKLLDSLFKKIQLIKISRHQDHRNRILGKSVVVNDEMLKFHENDRRGMYKGEWLERCGRIGLVDCASAK